MILTRHHLIINLVLKFIRLSFKKKQLSPNGKKTSFGCCGNELGSFRGAVHLGSLLVGPFNWSCDNC